MLLMLLLSLAQAGAQSEPALKSAIEPKLLNMTEMVGTDDYPVDAVRAGAEGTAHVRVRVNPEGGAESCKVVTSSGNADLDGQTCSVILARGRFSPGKDSRHRPVLADAEVRIHWALPDTGPEDLWTEQKSVLTIGPEGELRNCQIRAVIASKWVDAPPRVCEEANDHYSTDFLLAAREQSKLHDAVLVDDQFLLFGTNEPWPTPGVGPGEKLLGVLSLQMSVGKGGALKSCSVVRSEGEAGPEDPCNELTPFFGRLFAGWKADTNVRYINVLYLSGEPE